jgi:hypothetical protein
MLTLSLSLLFPAFAGSSAVASAPPLSAVSAVVEKLATQDPTPNPTQNPTPKLPQSQSEDTWPRSFVVDTHEVLVYPPHLQSWSGLYVTGVCAFSSSVTGSNKQTFGTISFTAATEVDRISRLVTLSNMLISGVSLPENPAKEDEVRALVTKRSNGKTLHIALDRFEAAVPGMVTAPSVASASLQNNPPLLSIANTPTVLVPIQGDPVLKPLPNTSLSRVINTPMLLVKDTDGKFWLKIADGWMTSASLSGNFTVGVAANKDLGVAATWAAAEPTINLLAPSAEDLTSVSDSAQTVSLAKSAPAIVVSTVPAEVLVTNGAPEWVEAGSSNLLYIANTSANIFKIPATGTIYVLISGRWFKANSTAGPWAFVQPEMLPGAFLMIPYDSPKENVLASVPGATQSQEAMIANTIPQMARIPVTQTLPAPKLIGELPKFELIAGTSVSVLVNCSTPVFETAPYVYFAISNGVWFTATSLSGPFALAMWVAPSIYTIPATSPYYYVTFCRVYNSTPEYLLVGYTPGYFGAYSQGGVVVYGTGYPYSAYCAYGWVPVPMTYGCGAAMCYNPWGGWAVGFGMGMAVGWAIGGSTWHCGPYPYWGPYGGAYGVHGAAAWGPHGWAATTGNVYGHYGNVSTMNRSSAGYNAWTGNSWSTHTATAYNSQTGARAAGQSGYVENSNTGNWAEGARGAGYNPTTGNYAAGKAGAAGTPGGETIKGGTATVGNAYTGNSAKVAGVQTDNGTWGAAKTDNGAAVAHNGDVYGVHNGNAYKYNGSTSSWQQPDKSGGWNNVSDAHTNSSLDDQRSARSSGDDRASNSSRWQSGGSGFSGESAGHSSSSGSNWGGGGGGSRSGGGGGSRSGGGGRR